MIELTVVKSPITDAWERDEAEPYACILEAPGVMARPWGVPMRLFGFPVGSASWEVFGITDALSSAPLVGCGHSVAWGLGLVVPETGKIFREAPFDKGRLTGLSNGDVIAVHYQFSIHLPGARS